MKRITIKKNHQTSHFKLNGHQIRIQRICLRLVACVKIDFGDIWKNVDFRH